MNSLVWKISVVLVKSLDIFGITLFLIYILHHQCGTRQIRPDLSWEVKVVTFLSKLLAQGIYFVVSHKKLKCSGAFVDKCERLFM